MLKVTKQSDGSFTCRVCFEIFKTIQDVTKHAPNCKEDATISNLKESMSCIQCHLLCDSKRVLDQHVYMVHESERKKGIKKSRCVICKKSFKLDSSLWFHVKNIKCEPVSQCHKCAKCGNEFSSLEALRAHKIKDHKKEYVCDKCDKVFEKHAELRNHKPVHEPKKEYPCVFKSCNRSYDHPNQLREHQYRHKRLLNSIPCEKCDKLCKDKTELEDHIKRMHIKKPYPFECSICQKKFRLKADMTLHVGLVHEGKKRKTCSECGKLYFESDLEEHMKSVHDKNVLTWPKSES